MLGVNKRKILDTAQKHLQKGALDKALREYNALLEADPRDTNVRLKIGDIHLRQGKPDDAVTAYLKVAEQFAKEGFDAKAVALYKLITKIAPKRLDVYEPLAELYQRLGLTSEAMMALQTAADVFQKEGKKREGLALLRKMATLDPGNTGTRLKIAELLWKEDLKDEALAEYDEVSAELDREGDFEGVVRVERQILELVPDRIDNRVRLARILVELDQLGEAQEELERVTIEQDDSVEGWEQLADVYQRRGNDKVDEAYRKLANLYRERGDDGRAREILQRFVAPEPLDGQTLSGQQPELETPDEGGVSLEAGGPDDPSVLETTGGTSPGGEATPPSLTGSEAAGATSVASSPSDGDSTGFAGQRTGSESTPDLGSSGVGFPRPEGDPAQLMAEAGVYLRYGKTTKAVACLEVILEQEPEHREAMVKLGDVLVESERDRAVDLFCRAAKVAHQEGDGASFAILRGRISELDEQAGSALEALESATPAQASSAEIPEFEIEIDDELELELDADTGAEAHAAAPTSESGDAPLELALEEDAPSLPMPEPPSVGELMGEVSSRQTPSGAETGQAGLSGSSSGEIEIDDLLEDAPPLDLGSDESQSELDVANELSLEEELTDESQFAIGADASLSQSGSAGPTASVAGEGVGEVSISFEPGESPVDAADGGVDVELGSAAQESVDDPAETSRAGAAASGVEASDPVSEANETTQPSFDSAVSSVSPTAVAEDLEEAEFYFQQGLHDDARGILERLLTVVPNHPQVLLRLGEIAEARGEGVEAASAAPTPSEETQSDEMALAFGDASDADDASMPLAASQADGATLADEAAASGTIGAEASGTEGPGRALDDPDAGGVGDAPEAVVASDDGDRDLRDEGSAGDLSSVDIAFDEDATAGAAQLALGADPGETLSNEPLSQDETLPVTGAHVGSHSMPSLETDDGMLSDGSDESFDLAAELSEVFEDEPLVGAGDSTLDASLGGTTREGFQAIFQEFKAGVAETLGAGHLETHYDLGIAYREMGLFDDAINEFRLSMQAPARRLDSLLMLGLCSFELGRYGEAIAHFEQGVAIPDAADSQLVALRFHLGEAYERSGDLERARQHFEQVAATDPDFGDVRDRIANLGQSGEATLGGLTGDTMGPGFETFDDLISSAELDDPDGDGDGGTTSGGTSRPGGRKRRKVSYG